MEPDELTHEDRKSSDKTASYDFVLSDLKQGWRFMVKAMNGAINAGLTDTASSLKSHVAGISADLEFVETMVERAAR